MKNIIWKLLPLVLWFMGSVSNAGQEVIIRDSKNTLWHAAHDLPRGAYVSILFGDDEKAEFFLARIKFSTGYKIPFHQHPINIYGTIISGEILLTFLDKDQKEHTVTLHKGNVMAVSPYRIHSILAMKDTVIQISGVGPWHIWYTHSDQPTN